MNISFFIKREYTSIAANTETNAVKSNLEELHALVVKDSGGNVLGVLTALDVCQNPKHLVVDCLTRKTMVAPSCGIEEAILIMQQEQTNVLPVQMGNKLDGLIFKDDLVRFVTTQGKELKLEVAKKTEEIIKMNDELKVSRQVLQGIFDSTDSIIFLIDRDYKITFYNRKAKESSRMFYKRELIDGANILDYTASNGEKALEQFKINFNRALSGESIISEREMPFPGRSFWIRTEYSPVYEYKAIIGVSIMVTDIDERKRHLLQIESQNEVLKRISWMQSHQTRQPVATILGLVNILDKTSLGKDNREIVELLERTVHKLDEVIRNTVLLANSAGGMDI